MTTVRKELKSELVSSEFQTRNKVGCTKLGQVLEVVLTTKNALEDLFLLPLSILSWVFPFFPSLPVLERRSFRAPHPPPFSLGDLTSPLK